MKEIKLTQGKIALVDDEDFEYLNQFKWFANRHRHTYYAIGGRSEQNGQKLIFMHRLIMNTPNDMQTDHLDHNGLNNQKYNLRNCTHQQNHSNLIFHKKGTSRYKGVCRRRGRYWSAQIGYNQRQIFLGHFEIEEDAALAYNKKAQELFGEFANINIIKN